MTIRRQLAYRAIIMFAAPIFLLASCASAPPDSSSTGGAGGSSTVGAGGSSTGGVAGSSTGPLGGSSSSGAGGGASGGAEGSRAIGSGGSSTGGVGGPGIPDGGGPVADGSSSALDGASVTPDASGQSPDGGKASACGVPFGDYPTTFQGKSLAVADFNRDGKPDVVVAADTQLAMFLSSSGALMPSMIARPAHPDSDLVPADVDGDGKLDLVGINGYDSSYQMRVYKGNGDGTFAAAEGYEARQYNAVAVGDLRGISRPDIVTAQYDQLNLFKNKGDGTFDPTSVIEKSNDLGFIEILFVADVNADQKPDVVAINSEMGGLNVLLGKGDGTFAPHVRTSGIDAYDLLAGFLRDLNGDGKLDLALPDASSPGLSVRLGNGDGSFGAAVDYPLPEEPASLTMGDVNHDGKADIVAVSKETLRVFLGNGDGTFGAVATQTLTGLNAAAAALADLDGDQSDDLVVLTGAPAKLSALHALGDGTFAWCPSSSPATGAPGTVCTSDAECETGRCLGTAVGGSKKYCSPQCNTASDCAEFSKTGGGFNIPLATNLQRTNNRWNATALLRLPVCDTIGPYTAVGADDGKMYCYFLCPANAAYELDSSGHAQGCACLPNFASFSGSTATYDCEWDSTVECSVFKACPTSTTGSAQCPQDVSCVVNADLQGTCFSKTANVQACVAATTCDGSCLANNCTSTQLSDAGNDPCVDMCCK